MRWSHGRSNQFYLAPCVACLFLSRRFATAWTITGPWKSPRSSSSRHSTKRFLASSSSQEDGGGGDASSSSSTTPRYRLLDERLLFRGPVDRGYGRGGKQLGFPTANLPSSLFQDALQDVANGVYFGWALLEGTTPGRNVPHKAVVNVGLSPTFEGAENAEKIIEAHLTVSDDLDPPDFYGETMRLQLDAFMRPEVKFDSFDALMAQITADVRDSNAALSDEPRDSSLRQSDFLTSDATAPWVGRGGGDEHASWEKVPRRE